MANNLTYAQRRLRALIENRGGEVQLSYTEICSELLIARETAITAVKLLERAGILQVERHRGYKANGYRLR